jgi:hypothetical protein
MDSASLTSARFVRQLPETSFHIMLFRSLLISFLLACFAQAARAQRPTATFIGGSVVRLELDGLRLFADAPGAASTVKMGEDDIALFVTKPTVVPSGGRAFLPSMTGPPLDQCTERLGEKTGIYVNPRPTPFGEVPHNSYLVLWNGRRIYFTGNTVDVKDLTQARDLDVAFVTPALLKAVEQANLTIDANMVVIYHIDKEAFDGTEFTVPCERCKTVLPAPGEVIQLFR